MFDILNLKNTVRFIILFCFQICFQNLNRTKNMDFISSDWYLRRKKPIVSIKYITRRMKHTLRVKCSTKIVYSFEDFNFIERISKIYVYRVYMFMCAGMFNYFYIHDLLYSCMCNDNKWCMCNDNKCMCNEYILYIVLIKRGKIQLVGENRKKWYGDRLHLIHDAPPLAYVFMIMLTLNKRNAFK